MMALSIKVTLSCHEARDDSSLSKTYLFDGWSAFLQRSFFLKSACSRSTGDAEEFCKKIVVSEVSKSVSIPSTTITKAPSIGAVEAARPTPKPGPLQAKDPQSRAESLPLAHYRPNDGPNWKEGNVKTSLHSTPLTVAASKPPGHSNCKKPPKPPRHPGRASSLDSSAGLGAQRCARKAKDRALKRKARTPSGSSSSGFTPLVALLLTLGFGVLIVFQGVFVQTNASDGDGAERSVVATDSRSSLSSVTTASSGQPFTIDPLLSASSRVDVTKTEALVSNAFSKSMQDLPWSRSSMASQVNAASR